jgi:4-amino-4-deoxy-L-arabinose transferase-like glycosyltransferase
MRLGAAGLAVAVRVALAGAAWCVRGFDAFLIDDSGYYVRLAQSLAGGQGFVDASGLPELFRTPLYPVLLVPGVWAGHVHLWALAINILAALAIVELTFRVARRVVRDEWLAAICAVVVAVEPTMLLWSVKVMPETLFALCVLAFAAALLAGRGALAALAIVAAAYTKPAAYPLVLISVVIVFLGHTRRGALRKGLAYVVMVMALLVPWHVRNARRAGFAGFSTLFDRALYISVAGSIESRRTHRTFAEVRREKLAAVPDPASMRQEGISRLTAHPLDYAAIHGQGMLRTLLEPGAIEYLRLFDAYPRSGGALANVVQRGLVRGAFDFAKAFPLAFWMSVMAALILLPLVGLPFLAVVRGPGVRGVGLLAIAAYFVIIAGGPPGSSRFRVPIVPILVVMSAFAIGRRDENAVMDRPGH